MIIVLVTVGLVALWLFRYRLWWWIRWSLGPRFAVALTIGPLVRGLLVGVGALTLVHGTGSRIGLLPALGVLVITGTVGTFTSSPRWLLVLGIVTAGAAVLSSALSNEPVPIVTLQVLVALFGVTLCGLIDRRGRRFSSPPDFPAILLAAPFLHAMAIVAELSLMLHLSGWTITGLFVASCCGLVVGYFVVPEATAGFIGTYCLATMLLHQLVAATLNRTGLEVGIVTGIIIMTIERRRR